MTGAASPFLHIDPAEWVASNDLAFAVRDSYPVGTGHTLVVPRRVVSDWWSATPDEREAMLELIDQVKRRLDAELSPDGYNVGFNSGAAAGQTVDHLHIHVIPRFLGDMADPRGGVRHVIPERGNYLAPGRATASGPGLVTPFDGRLKLELLRCLIREDLDRIDLLVSFVMRSGINLIARHVDDALERGAHIRLLTTDYLQVTDTAALGFFLDRLTDGSDGPDGRLEARVFSDPRTSFHPKAYIFSSSSTGAGVAFVGSSNLSYSGIATGVEWNVQSNDTGSLVAEFDRLWADDRSIPLTLEWLEEYEHLRRQRRAEVDSAASHELEVAIAAEAEVEPELAPRPWSVQNEALNALVATRHDGHAAGLVVMATGLGKTWLAAFDSTRPEFKRVMFVAHREEILTQSRDVFRQIRPDGGLTLFTGEERDPDGDVVFASVQSLHRNLGSFERDAFDYIVVDEFHHAAADTYRRVLAHFQPRFLLGLTATPNRADAADLLALCSDNLVYDCGLVEGVRRDLLSPFRYRAIPDVANYEHVPWRNGRFDLEELTNHIATLERADQVFNEWEHLGGAERRALGFCCTIAHADFMAEHFRSRGVNAVAVHSGPSSSQRTESLERLEAGALPIVFTVDLFNEGVDVPAIDVVMMLRPTESSVVFLQQLGRGLRRSAGKDRLEVVDLVGNHRGFLLKARLLANLAGHSNLTDREAVDLLRREAADLAAGAMLPDGCSILVDPEVVDLLREMLGPARPTDRLVELVREWNDEHGRRPTALEIAVLTGQPFNLKPRGGWFGFLAELGLLNPEEQRVATQAREFLLWIEHGSYTKSYKLVTLLALHQLGGLRGGIALRDIAATSRWMLFADANLMADLSDAGSSFEDVMHPTVAEWESYWRRNPIAALTNATRGQSAWFTVEDDRLEPTLRIDDDVAGSFEAMVHELVEYRLHRYLVTQSARRVGEVRKPVDRGVEVDATFRVETTGTTPSSVVIESAGGTAGTPSARNTQYVDGIDLVLRRLADVDAQLIDAYVDTGRTASLSVADRRLDVGETFAYPVHLNEVEDLKAVRRAMLRSMARVGRAPGTSGSGNARKRTRLVIAVSDDWSAVSLADALAHGDQRLAETAASDAH